MYPSFSEYLQAIEFASETLNALRRLRPVRKPDGRLYFSSGNFAAVFRMEDTETGAWVALRCFLRDVPRRQERLFQIAEYIRNNPSPYLLPITYYPREIWVETRFGLPGEFDLMTMPWAEGQSLSTYVANCCACNDQRSLQALAHRFDELANWLLSTPFAHGDLKPDNILIGLDGSLRLIDYDGCYVPNLHGLPSAELGSPPYRHPGRQSNHFNPHLDDFSLLLLSLELHTLSHDPALYNPTDSLLLLPADVEEPADSLRWEQLRQLASPAIRARLALLEFARYIPPGPVHSLKALFVNEDKPSNRLPTPFRWGDQWGFVDQQGQFLIAPDYQDVHSFSEGLAVVQKDGRFGYVTSQGALAVPCTLLEARDFSEGMAVVRAEKGCFLIDSTGKPVSAETFAEMGPCRSGLAPVRQGNQWGFMNGAGEVQIPCQFDSAWPFTDGLARVRQGGQFRFIDAQGAVAIAGPFSYATNFANGWAAVEEDGQFGFIDTKGQWRVPPQYDEVGIFSEGLASVSKQGRVGFIDDQGQLVIPMLYESLRMAALFPFSEGLAVVKQMGRLGYVNGSGQVAIPLRFDEACSFSEGLAAVRNKDRWGYINRAGQLVVPYMFVQAYSFRNGLARVRQGDVEFYIDQSGRAYYRPQ